MSLLALCLLLAGAPQDPPKPLAPPVDEQQVDAAIKKGVAWLRTAPSPGAHAGIKDSDELIVWTFLHAGVRESDPDFQKYFKKMLEGTLEKTYKVALQAMILEEMDRVKYQERIAQCGQFLVDNQCANGQWSYGEFDPFAQDVPTGTGKKAVASTGGKAKPEKPVPGLRTKPKVVNAITVKSNRKGPARGDNSNSQ